MFTWICTSYRNLKSLYVIMAKREFIWKDKNGNIIDREVRYDIVGEPEISGPINMGEIRRKRKLIQKGFSNLTEEEKEEWIRYFGGK